MKTHDETQAMIDEIFEAVLSNQITTDHAAKLLGIPPEDALIDIGYALGEKATLFRLAADGVLDPAAAARELGLTPEQLAERLALFRRNPLQVLPLAYLLEQVYSPLEPDRDLADISRRNVKPLTIPADLPEPEPDRLRNGADRGYLAGIRETKRDSVCNAWDAGIRDVDLIAEIVDLYDSEVKQILTDTGRLLPQDADVTPPGRDALES